MHWAMDELQARAHAQLNALRDYSENLDRVRVRASSENGLVTAEVNGAGGLVGLQLSPDATAVGGQRLGAAAALAAQRAFARRAALTDEFRTSFADMTGTEQEATS